MGASGAQWVISIYALLFGSLLLPAGRLGDRVGHRRLFTIGLAAFAAGSLLCGVAPSGAVLIAARAGTGIAAALTVPSALALLVAGTDEARRPRALGWWTAAGAGGGVAGLALGGVLTAVAGWRAAFIVPAGLALACLPLVSALGPGPAGDDRRPLDVGGALAAVAGSCCSSPVSARSGRAARAFRRGCCWRGPRSRCSPSCGSRPGPSRHCSPAACSPTGDWRRARWPRPSTPRRRVRSRSSARSTCRTCAGGRRPPTA